MAGWGRAAVRATLATATAAACGLVALPAAAAAETYPVPADRTFTLSGRGYGHGAGLSQYGAKARAGRGQTASQVLGFYYPGTTLTTIPAADIDVVLTDHPTTVSTSEQTCASAPPTGTPCLRVTAEPGATVARDGAGPVALPSSGVAQWGVGVSGGALALWQRDASGVWSPVPGVDAATTAYELRPADGALQVVFRDGSARSYRGVIRAVPAGEGLARINRLPLDSYLRGVVASEMPASWPAAALQAQAVAARTYADGKRAAVTSDPWDICDSTACQVYKGLSGEDSRTTAAIDANGIANRVLRSGSARVDALFSSSNGGWTLDGGTTYLKAQTDPDDPVNPWTAELSAAALETRYGLGRMLRLVVEARDGHGTWGGRVTRLRLDFTRGSTTLTGATPLSAQSAVRGVGSLRSSWFTVVRESNRSLAGFATAPGNALLTARTPTGGTALWWWSAAAGPGAVANLGGATPFGPAVASPEAGAYDLFVTGRDRRLWTRGVRSGTGWSAWAALPTGSVDGRPAALRLAPGQVHVFAIDALSHGLLHRWRIGSTWSGWQALAGRAAAGTGPGAAATGTGALVTCLHSAWHTVHCRRYLRGWSAWRSYGAPPGTLAGDPAVTSTAVDTATVVVRAADGTLWASDVSGLTGAQWRRVGSSGPRFLDSPVALAVPGTDRVDVLATGVDEQHYRATRSAGVWSAWTVAD